MSDDVAIRVENVSKDFVLPHERVNSVKSLFTSLTKGLNRRKETQHALKDISFEIKKGEFFGIVGRNGSGKSTLLKILAGIYQPTSGRTETHGKLVPFIELGVGFNPELTGRENVYMNGAMLGFSEKEVEGMYDDIVQFAELERFMDQKLKNYSSGMQVRLAFSMATRSEADILLIDEVLAVGDADFQRKCYEYFNQLKRQKKTVVFVSHDMDAIQRYCDRTMVIDSNRVVQIGDTLKAAEKYIKLFSDQSAGDTSKDDEDERWGDGSLEISDIEVKVTDTAVTISHKVTSVRSVESPTAGIRIRSSTGQPITGTSTQLERVKLPNMEAGKHLKLEWRIPNVFSDGRYYIDPAVARNEGAVIADWWDKATTFTIKKRRALPYPVDPSFTVKVEHN
jgi:ABC-2 type transport system ATP-binding protein